MMKQQQTIIISWLRKAAFLLSAGCLAGCQVTDSYKAGNTNHPVYKNQTIIVFMPWATNLLPAFSQNIKDIEKAVLEKKCDQAHILVCLSTSETQSVLMELHRQKSQCMIDTLEKLPYASFSQDRITHLLEKAQEKTRTSEYSMIIGCHGMGWLPAIATAKAVRRNSLHFERTDVPQTRWFGGTSPEYQIEVSTLAEAIRKSDMHMNFILFDDCYMSSVEVAYDLKDVTDYLIACPTEIMKYGYPYYQCLPYLVGDKNYEELCNTFIAFYGSYQVPSGTIAVTDCRQLDRLAETVRQIESLPEREAASIQKMDGYEPAIFYDFGDYIRQRCPDEPLLYQFEQQMKAVVPFKGNTPSYYSANNGWNEIYSFSGLTTSVPTRNGYGRYYKNTAWYQATHKTEENKQETTK